MSLSANAQLVSQNHQKTSSASPLSLSGIATTLKRIGTTWAVRRRRMRDMQALYTFSDRELWDIGLGRSDLPAIENGSFHRD